MDEPNPLLGTWKLAAIRAIYADGTVDAAAYGPAPVGYITYTAEGHMMVMFAQGDRPPLRGNPNSPFDLAAVPAAELAQAFSSFSAYAGTYTLAGDTVTHHVAIASIPDRVGLDLVRRVVLADHQLILQTPPLPQNPDSTQFELIWERVTRCLA
ncbi:MAG: hypothetical protein Fur0046_02380 [Cyanobacteria bacterium J069]|nr:MAG: lipocalin-like domain-containing protein [Cyanobacteria bacterium J069]